MSHALNKFVFLTTEVKLQSITIHIHIITLNKAAIALATIES
jgi:hypothetical protein